jgi:hypothetical protein
MFVHTACALAAVVELLHVDAPHVDESASRLDPLERPAGERAGQMPLPGGNAIIDAMDGLGLEVQVRQRGEELIEEWADCVSTNEDQAKSVEPKGVSSSDRVAHGVD